MEQEFILCEYYNTDGEKLGEFKKTEKQVLHDLLFYQYNYGKKLKIDKHYDTDGNELLNVTTKYNDKSKYIYKNIKGVF